MRENYKNFKFGGHLCELPIDVLQTLITTFETVKNTKPDSGTINTYRQWYLQDTQQLDNHFLIEESYVVWRSSYKLTNVLEYFSKYVETICRFRMSYLPKGLNVDYHARHQLPRIHIPLNECNSTFVVKDEDDVEHMFDLKFGHAYFLNVTYPHKVVGDNLKERENCFFCFTDFTSNFKQQHLK